MVLTDNSKIPRMNKVGTSASTVAAVPDTFASAATVYIIGASTIPTKTAIKELIIVFVSTAIL